MFILLLGGHVCEAAPAFFVPEPYRRPAAVPVPNERSAKRRNFIIDRDLCKGGVRKREGRNDAVVSLRAAAEGRPPQALRSHGSLLFASVPPLTRNFIIDNCTPCRAV